MITPQQFRNPQVKPKWQLPVGVMESVVAYNCRKYGMPRPVLAMPMREGAGNRALDYSGHGNHGAITGADWVSDGLSFVSANGDYVLVPYDSTLDFPDGSAFSICTIFKTSSTKQWNSLVGKYDIDGAPYEGYNFGLDDSGTDDGKLYFGCTTEEGNLDTSTTYHDDIFHFGVVVKDNTTRSIFVDGKCVVSGSCLATSIGDQNNGLYIGSQSYDPTNRNFDGIIKACYIFNTTLSAVQVKFLTENPYFMYEIPEELYSYVPAAAGVSIPVFLHLYNQMRQ